MTAENGYQDRIAALESQLATEREERQGAERERDRINERRLLLSQRMVEAFAACDSLRAQLAEANEARDETRRQCKALEPLLPDWRPGEPIIEAAGKALAEARKDTERLGWIQQWLTEDPTRFQVAFRRLETTGEFICAVRPGGNGAFNRAGKTVPDAIDAAIRALKEQG